MDGILSNEVIIRPVGGGGGWGLEKYYIFLDNFCLKQPLV